MPGRRLQQLCAGADADGDERTATPGLAAGTSYSYRVRATDAAGNLGGYSNVASATTPTAPDTHAAEGAERADGDGGAQQPDQSDVDGGDGQRGGDGVSGGAVPGRGLRDFAQVGTATATTFSDTGLAAGTSYSYRVRATDAAGNLGGYSTVASATTAATPPAIAFVQSEFRGAADAADDGDGAVHAGADGRQPERGGGGVEQPDGRRCSR